MRAVVEVLGLRGAVNKHGTCMGTACDGNQSTESERLGPFQGLVLQKSRNEHYS